MKRLFSLVTLILITAALPILPRTADAQSVFVDPTVQAVATEIVNVTIVATQNVVVDGEPHTVATAAVDATLVGETADTILVEVPGGELPDGTVVRASHQPEFKPGDQVQVALVATPAEEADALLASLVSDLVVYSVVGGHDGAFWLSDGGGEAQGANDFNLMGTRWSSFAPAVPYKVNAAGSGLSAAETQAAVQRGFQTWEDDGGSNIDFTYAGASTIGVPDLGDGVNNISWVSTPNPADTWLAQALWFTDMHGGVLGFDIKFNSDYAWANGAQGGRYDIGTVLVHEAGHAIGLGHVGVASEVMYYSISPGGIKPLGAGDRNGAAHLYPAPVWSAWGQVPGSLSSVAIDANADGRLEVIGTNGGGGIYHVSQTTPGGTWSAWKQVPGGLKSVAVGRNADGRLEVFGTNVYDSIYHMSQTTPAGAWSAWTQVPGSLSSVAIEANADGRLEVIGTNGGGGIYHMSQTTPGGAWSAWKQVPGSLKSIAMGRNGDGRLEVFGTNAYGSIYHMSQTTPGGAWSAWTQVPGSLSSVAIEANADGRLEVIGTNGGGGIYHMSQTTPGGAWSAWKQVPGSLKSIAVGRNADGRLEVFGTNAYGGIYHMSQVNPGGA